MKKMNFFVMLVSGLLTFSAATAQKDSSGIYKTANDFVTGKLSLAINCATEMHKIKLNDFFGKDYITVVHDGKKYDFKKSEVYGYKLCDEKIYRFSGKTDYVIMNPSEKILLYTKEVMQGSKGARIRTNTYYFSNGAASPIVELTIDNLKKAYPNNHKFHDALDSDFKNGEGLASYDSFHKMYRVNHILQMNAN